MVLHQQQNREYCSHLTFGLNVSLVAMEVEVETWLVDMMVVMILAGMALVVVQMVEKIALNCW